jgi:DNA repair exonuclease SbcCD ATPase subunit
VDAMTMTEDELAALIDQAVTQAIAATEQTTDAVTTTTSDDAVTADEVAYVYSYYYNADYYVAYAEELMAQYYALYGDLAEEMMVEMDAIQSELSQMNDTLTQVSTSLEEINSTLSQGLELAQESITQLEEAAQQAQTNAQELKAQAQDMMSTLQQDQQGRLDQLAQIQPDNIPTDKLSALHSAFDFLDAANGALGDDKISRDELMNLAQLGKNAQEGFKQFGGLGQGGGAGGGAGGGIGGGAGGGLGKGDGEGMGLDLTQFSGKFDEITTDFARGQTPKGRDNVKGFESSLGKRPSRRN